MKSSRHPGIEWPGVPELREERYKTKAAEPLVSHPLEEALMTSEEVLDEAPVPEVAHVRRKLGRVASLAE